MFVTVRSLARAFVCCVVRVRMLRTCVALVRCAYSVGVVAFTAYAWSRLQRRRCRIYSVDDVAFVRRAYSVSVVVFTV